MCFVICSASTVGRTQQEAARGSGFGTNWKRCACRAHPDAKPSPSQKNLLAPHAVGCATSMAGLHTWIWDIQFHQFHEIHQLILTQCISMYLNVSQCISMHLNATHELVLTFTFSCCRTNNSQFRLGRWSHAPELRLPRTGTR